MKNILLVLQRDSAPSSTWKIFSPGLMYISSSMKQAGLSVYILNLILEEGDLKPLLEKKITEHKIDLVATGGLVFNWQEMKRIMDTTKEIDPSIVTLIGGGLVTHSPKEALELIPSADYGVLGEGEITDVALIQALDRKEDLSTVEGIIYRKDGEFIITAERPPIMDLDALPWPDYEGFRYLEMIETVSGREIRSIPITTSRSCPFSCTFCCTSGGKIYRQRSLESIFAEMDYLIKQYQANDFILNDELFATNESRIYEFCQFAKENKITWAISLRVSRKLTEELFTRMRESGCRRIQFGLESANDTVLKSMKKGITVSEIHHTLNLAKKTGVLVEGNFIFGDTAETVETMESTMDWAYEHAELIPRGHFSPIKLYPGSALYHKAISEGKITNPTEFIREGIPLINVSSMSDEEYYDMRTKKIPMFEAKYKNHALSFHQGEQSLSFSENQKNHYKYEFHCPQCQKALSYTVSAADLNMWLGQCSFCGENNEAPLSYLYFKYFEKELAEAFRTKKCAIWGTGGVFYQLYENNKYLQENQVFLLDKSQQKQESGFQGQKIYDPEVLESLQVDVLFLCVDGGTFKVLNLEVAEKFPSIPQILWIFEISKLK